MGITYKLKQEIVDFIVMAKKENSSLSYREISLRIQDKFQKKVSKSSVGFILKKESLNSLVGRKGAKSVDIERSKAPDKKKEVLCDPIKKHKPISEKNREENDKGIDIESKSGVEDLVFDKQGEKKVSFQCLSQKEKKKQQVFYSGILKEYDNAGLIFIKVAQWFISDRPFIIEALKGLVEYCPQEDDVLMEVVINGFVAVQRNDFKRCEFLDAISGIVEKEIEMDKVFQKVEWLKTTSVSDRSRIKYKLSIDSLLLRVGGVLLKFVDGGQVFIDINGIKLSTGVFDHKQVLFFNKGMAYISKNFICNKEAIFIGDISGHSWDDLDRFCNEKTSNISVLDERGEVLAVFSTVSQKQRIFVLGIWEGSQCYRDIEKTLRWQKKEFFYMPEVDNVISYVDKNVVQGELEGLRTTDALRIMAFWLGEEEKPVAIVLTNSEEDRKSLIRQFFLKWFSRVSKHKRLDIGDLGNLWRGAKALSHFEDVCMNLVKMFYNMVPSVFLEGEDDLEVQKILQDIYGLRGGIYRTKDTIVIRLRCPKREEVHNLLIRLMNSANSLNIKDYDGRNVIIQVG